MLVIVGYRAKIGCFVFHRHGLWDHWGHCWHRQDAVAVAIKWEKKAGKLQRCKLHIVQDHDFNRVVDTIGCFVAHMKTSLASPSWIYQIVMIVIWVSLSLRRADFRRCYIHVEVIVQMGREIWVVAFLVKLEKFNKSLMENLKYKERYYWLK